MRLSLAILLVVVASCMAVPVDIFRAGGPEEPLGADGTPRYKDAFPPGNPEKEKEGRMGSDPQTIPAQVGTDCGVSCNTNREASGTGPIHKLNTDNLDASHKFQAVPDSVADGGTHPPGHVSLKSTEPMNAQQYKDEVNKLPWEKDGRIAAPKKGKKRGLEERASHHEERWAKVVRARDVNGAPYWLLVDM